MSKTFTVLLFVEASREYGRRLLRAITNYSRLNGSWILEHQTPFYLRTPQEGFSIDEFGKIDGLIIRGQRDVPETQ